jgi:hypothetical protein
MPQLPWIDLQSISLLQLIIQHGGHVATRSTVTKVWTDILESFKKQECIQNYVQDYFSGKSSVEGIRKLREKLKSLIEKAQKEMGLGDFMSGKTANLSKHGGELAKVYGLVKQILIEQQDDEERSLLAEQEKENQRKKLEQIEKDAFNLTKKNH